MDSVTHEHEKSRVTDGPHSGSRFLESLFARSRHTSGETVRSYETTPTTEAPRAPITEQWKDKHYAEVPTTIERGDVEDAVDVFRDFLTLPESAKSSVSIPGPQGRGKGSLGYVERTPETDAGEKALGNDPEHKEYFHYHPSVETTLPEAIQRAGPKAEQLIAHLRVLWAKMEAVAYQTIARLEAENAGNSRYDGITSRFFPDGITEGKPGLRHPKLTLRLMIYKKVDSEKLAANGHYDAGTFAFAVCESAPGLMVGEQAARDESGAVTKPETLTPATRPDGTALFWPGTGFKNIDPAIGPTWHAVKQHTTDDVKLGEENRWVLVAFLNEYEEREAPSLAETHGLTA